MDTQEIVTEQGGLADGLGASAATPVEVQSEPDAWTNQWTAEEWNEWNAGRWRARDGQHSGSRRAAIGAGESTGDSPDPWTAWRGPGSWQNQWWDKPGKGDYSDPPPWSGWSRYRLWKRSLTRWGSNTDVLLKRRSEKILKSMDWELQSKLDHLTDAELQGQDYLKVIFSVLDVLAGEKEESEKRRCVRAALYEGPRKSEETLAQYSLRREAQFTAASRYVNLPGRPQGFHDGRASRAFQAELAESACSHRRDQQFLQCG